MFDYGCRYCLVCFASAPLAFQICTKSSSCFVDGPRSPTVASAESLRTCILFLSDFPSSPSISSFTQSATCCLSTMPNSLGLTLMATFKSSASSTAFSLCSANSGQAISGTPLVMLSRVEFQPQCDKNPAVEP
ncbi:hypothetical protein AKJ16_DCAP00861 [Drosera capensis]